MVQTQPQKPNKEIDRRLGILVFVPVLVAVGLALVRFGGRVVTTRVIDEIGWIGREERGAVFIEETVHVVGAGQVMVHQDMSLSNGADGWVQALTATVPIAGTLAKLSDSYPIADKWNFAAVEILSKPDAAASNRGAPITGEAESSGSRRSGTDR